MSNSLFLALSGGVGGAKLALGLAHALPQEQLRIIVNTGDDFEHLGLHISPDLDTVMYTLAGVANPETGWGRADESWNFLESLGQIGAENWFRLGDRDLAVHVERTQRLRAGESLSEVTARLCTALNLHVPIIPMSDFRVRTIVQTEGGELDFQHYFVRERCAPQVTGFRFEGAESAQPSPAFLATLSDPRLRALLLCPSNPFVSVDPILAIPEVTTRLAARSFPIVAVSPIVGGQAVKGPLGKMLGERGLPCDSVQIARYYKERGLLDGFIFDETDKKLEPEIAALGVKTFATRTVMTTLSDRTRLARETIAFAEKIA